MRRAELARDRGDLLRLREFPKAGRLGRNYFCLHTSVLPHVTKGYVLVVEDDPALRALYRAALQAAGFAVVSVEDGLDALRLVELEKPKAVVLDLDLPRVAGRDVEQELRAHPETHHIPIIVVSGKDTQHLDPRDFACILHKPISPDELVAAVHRCLAKTTRSDESTT